jgi:hypothetical protein
VDSFRQTKVLAPGGPCNLDAVPTSRACFLRILLTFHFEWKEFDIPEVCPVDTFDKIVESLTGSPVLPQPSILLTPLPPE